VLARQWHIRDVEADLPDGPGTGGVPRAKYDPDRFALAQREGAKAAELSAIGPAGDVPRSGTEG
jgi:hypothetical protein